MRSTGTLPRLALMLLAVAITALALALAAPRTPLELHTLGNADVNTAPAIRISLAGKSAPEAAPETPAQP